MCLLILFLKIKKEVIKLKKIFGLAFIFLSSLALISCGSDGNDSNTGSNNITQTGKNEYTEAIGFTFHYYRNDADYENYNMWIWENGQNGKDYSFTGVDDYGAYMTFSWSDFTDGLKNSSINFIVKEAKPWSSNPLKDVEMDRSVVFSSMDFSEDDGLYHIYLKSGDEAIYGVKQEVGEEITKALFDVDYKTKKVTLNISTNKDVSLIEVKNNGKTIISTNDLDESKVIKYTDKEFIYLFDEIPDISSRYIISATFRDSLKIKTTVASFTNLYSSEVFNNNYYYDGELGAIYSKEKTTFKVWSPVSTNIELRVYNTGTPEKITINGKNVSLSGGDNAYKSYPMTKGEKGVWSVTLNEDLEGKYYTYSVTNSAYKGYEIVDPYAKSAGINGLRGMVVDFNKTNPEGWDNVNVIDYNSQSLTVYECHIADLTSSSTWNGDSDKSKTYQGFYQEGTSYTSGNTTVKTGFDHIKELGVNAVQLLPIFDQANDERLETRTFNWGYNPLNYNVLEGSYSSNPYDGYVRIKEFKELVKAYNEAGINIIMDVVYNHVNSLAKSNFDVLMPNYYFRYSNGSISNGSGCGNETASDMQMFRKFMIDSTEFLASEYKLSGFRFDLMGLHDYETMNLLTKNLHDNVNSNITIYGEPWTGGTTALAQNLQATQSNLSKFEGFGCFNDKLRDALIKGGLSAKTDKGWVTETKKTSSTSDIISGLIGSQTVLGNDPYKTVNYVTCHDNYTLYDRIKASGITDEETIRNMALLANSVVFTSQGITFMLSGEEFLRTKSGNNNSYNASYKINELDYSLKVKNIDVFNNYKKLISLKQNSNLFARTKEECKNIVINKNSDGSLIYFDLNDDQNMLQYRIALSNGYKSKASKIVDFNGYTLYLDTLNKENLILSSETVIDELEVVIAYKAIE